MCATEQGLPSLLPVCESFAFKELIPQCVHTYCSCWVYSALTNFYIFFSEGNFRWFFCCCLGGGLGLWVCLRAWQHWRLKSFICLHGDYNIKFFSVPSFPSLLSAERQAVEKHTYFMISALREVLLEANCGDGFL